jgi:hypothetical protein
MRSLPLEPATSAKLQCNNGRRTVKQHYNCKPERLRPWWGVIGELSEPGERMSGQSSPWSSLEAMQHNICKKPLIIDICTSNMNRRALITNEQTTNNKTVPCFGCVQLLRTKAFSRAFLTYGCCGPSQRANKNNTPVCRTP